MASIWVHAARGINIVSRKKILIIGLCGVVGFLIAGTAIAQQTSNKPSSPSTDTSASAPTNDPPTDTAWQPTGEEGDNHAEEETPIIISGQTIERSVIASQVLPVAENAARQYVQQSTNESRDQRSARLKTVFHPDSLVVYDRPPAVDPTRSQNTSSNGSVLYSRWDTTDQMIVATVALKITTTDNADPGKVISEIYQAWDVGLTVKDGTYTPRTINFNNTPIVIQR